MSAVFSSGAKSSEQKPRYDLIPASALKREAQRMAEGAEAHGVDNYKTGVGDAEFIIDRCNHMIEHALLYSYGDRSTDHLAAIRANAGMLIWLEEHAQKPATPQEWTPAPDADVPQPYTVAGYQAAAAKVLPTPAEVWGANVLATVEGYEPIPAGHGFGFVPSDRTKVRR